MEFFASESVTVTGDGVTLDMLIWRRFRQPMDGVLEALMAMPDNYGLAALPAVLPLGTVVTIPIPRERTTGIALATSLWD